jgi:hypothetical protein
MRLPWRRSYTVFATDPPPMVADRPRTFTQQHQALLTTLGPVNDEPWSQAAVRACLEHLGISTTTEAADVAVEDAWLDGPTAFCVVYRVPFFDGLAGLRRDASDARPSIEGDSWDRTMMTSGYDMADQSVLDGQLPDPVGFGWNVADFDIGEPHDLPDGGLDELGIHWGGNLTGGLPARP